MGLTRAKERLLSSLPFQGRPASIVAPGQAGDTAQRAGVREEVRKRTSEHLPQGRAKQPINPLSKQERTAGKNKWLE